MRRLSTVLGGLLLAGGLISIAGISPASAQCPAGDGSIPDSGSTVTPIGTGDSTKYTTIYVDDRDYPDLDEDNNSGGIWLYIETNEVAGLQRGGDMLPFTFVNPNAPRVEPVPILPANPGGAPVFPNGFTLFPDGFGGGSLSEAAGAHDDCHTDQNDDPWTGPADAILF